MNRRQFLSASIMTSLTALLFSRRNTAAEHTPEPPPPQAEGWCLEYIPPPNGTDEGGEVYIPIAQRKE